MEKPIIIPPHIQEQMRQTQERQAAEDAVGLKAATTALPGVMKDIFAPAPDIEVGTVKVKRFVDRHFVFLSHLNHPLNRFTAISDGSYTFEPSGELAWQLCFLLTHEISEIKELFKSGGAEAVKETAADEFGECTILAIAEVMKAIAKQMEIYAGAQIELVPNAEGEKSAHPQQ